MKSITILKNESSTLSIFTKFILIFFILNVIFKKKALHAIETKGPTISWQKTTKSKIKNNTNPESRATKEISKINIDIKAPLFTFTNNQNLYLDTHWSEEKNSYTLTNKEPEKTEKNSFIKLGLIYLDSRPKTSIVPFITGAIYSHPNWQKNMLPMREFIIGATYDKHPFPDLVNKNLNNKFHSLVLIRFRKYPGFQRFLLYFGNTLYTQNGWSFSLYIPGHVNIAWRTQDYNQTYFIEARIAGKDIPTTYEQHAGWYVGYNTRYTLGMRYKIHSPVYLGLQTGLESENMTFYDSSGRKLNEYSTNRSFYIKISLETWINNKTR